MNPCHQASPYCRVSRILGQCIENQVTPLTEFANSRGYRIAGTYADEGQSGAKTRRPQLDAMLRDARAGKFEVLAVVALDRLGRDLRHLLSLLDELNGLGSQFVSLREALAAKRLLSLQTKTAGARGGHH